MTTNLDLINERQRLASVITSILEGNVIDESTGEVSYNTEDFHLLEELQLSMDDNHDNIVNKTEAIGFAIQAQQAKLENYKDVVKTYQALSKRTEATIEYLKGLARINIEAVGTDGKLPTPSFPKLKLNNQGKGKTVINENYRGLIEPEVLKPRSLKDISLTLLKERYKNEAPLDENDEPLFYIVKSEPTVSFK